MNKGVRNCGSWEDGMTDEPSEFDLHAYVDDQLDAGRRFAVEAHLADNPALAAYVMGELSTRTGLRLLGGNAVPLPPAIQQPTAAMGERPSRPFWRRGAPLGAGVALVAALSALLLLPSGRPAYVDMAVASHRVAMMRAHMTSQLETVALDHGEILKRTRIDLPALPADWHVTDVQIFPTGSGPALLVAVRTVEGRTLSLFAMRERSDAPEIPDAVREGYESVAYWRRGDMSYALTGEGEPGIMDKAAEGLNRLWS